MAVSGHNNVIRKTKKGVRWIADIPGADEATILNIMSQISGMESVMGTMLDHIEKGKVYLPSDAPKFTTFPIPKDFMHDNCAPIKLTMVFADPGLNVHVGEDNSPVTSIVVKPSPGAKGLNDMLTYGINKYMENVLGMAVQSAEAKPLITIHKGRYVHICVYVTLLEDGESYGGEGQWIQFDEFDAEKFKGITKIVMEEFFQAIRPMSKEEFEKYEKDVEDAFESTEKVLQEE